MKGVCGPLISSWRISSRPPSRRQSRIQRLISASSILSSQENKSKGWDSTIRAAIVPTPSREPAFYACSMIDVATSVKSSALRDIGHDAMTDGAYCGFWGRRPRGCAKPKRRPRWGPRWGPRWRKSLRCGRRQVEGFQSHDSFKTYLQKLVCRIYPQFFQKNVLSLPQPGCWILTRKVSQNKARYHLRRTIIHMHEKVLLYCIY
jgi:hypothetical protein